MMSLSSSNLELGISGLHLHFQLFEDCSIRCRELKVRFKSFWLDSVSRLAPMRFPSTSFPLKSDIC